MVPYNLSFYGRGFHNALHRNDSQYSICAPYYDLYAHGSYLYGYGYQWFRLYCVDDKNSHDEPCGGVGYRCNVGV